MRAGLAKHSPGQLSWPRKPRKMARPSRGTKETEMQRFQIVRQISGERKQIDGRLVDTLMAIVRFPDSDTTRHLQRHDGRWTGWNSDRARRERAGILETRQNYDEAVADGESLVSKLEAKLADLKGKRGTKATAERKRLRELIKGNKATLAVLKTGQAHAVAIADKVDETHPEIVEFA
ncbi:MAG: hypothetical protein A2651_02370 [Candidatus Yanofskybacteria bacterium RIFCSPHIGHO2_01_FULL_42_12]|uniref:Uncharacterized protein n=1 Tax=Candidatus Yanofskybacteria bacterium RIFCSPLOWO2_01_FULL_42_49 TaxID=1802694 RepID=A0A1F8GEB1_9BACT|nr:MAG: hypothetical protein A2651_02370 [Candidatus Yanofskybacteria bacterium RIFCSPHIGHO2_01_FULL_42_12]OGN22799.1 MAG: hypothetical protein A2918_01525 [Candidatus Yanofskybacteria bacterium RIFCSPLOWO2_01_FULL_42_49]